MYTGGILVISEIALLLNNFVKIAQVIATYNIKESIISWYQYQ